MDNHQEAEVGLNYSAVVFDWAGTTVDFGSFAPMGVFVELFAASGIDVSIDEARAPMGLPKRDHIKAMLDAPRIAAAWTTAHGRPAGESDIDDLYRAFLPMNEKVAAHYATLVPGAGEAVAALRAKGLKIGSTTGYTRSIMEHVLPVAAKQGYSPDNLVCSDDLPFGRPTPMGIYKCCLDLGVADARRIVKVDDTEPGIAEGVAAGCLTVGVAMSGNYVGRTVDELSALDEAEIAALRAGASDRLLAAGADHIIDTVADLPALLERLG
ncbi:phosphonoacetaldehyde hydrolase [Hoeflea poritis]|uniref:Phosphonoacetaldehyde hydrolase n=1 Tax=Hoeflea poritis TaxID=2993659 RepID=A0ABT4VTY8_9HYPH|nr:phosphonoacetaldehyde hydrolase [Hoeflea poritis]MDA4848172.1 phosphonoacetaldehyde hydrolase [Hoeflea poritis]